MNRQGQWRLISLANFLLLVACFGLGAWLSSRYVFEADLTRSGRHTLSGASLQLLQQLEGPLQISAYAREDSALRKLVSGFVGKYQKARPDITLQFVNPDAVPDEVRQLGINVNGELVLRYGGRKEHVRTNSEQEFANALQRLLRGTERWLAFLDGHGERHPTGKANHDLGEWTSQLKYRGFKFRPLNLAETAAVPDNTSVLIIASPLVQVLPGEVPIIQDYLQRGGNLLWLIDPGDVSGLQAVAAFLGIQFSNGVVIDEAGQLLGINDPTIALTTASLYPDHPVTTGFELPVFFPRATEIRASSPSEWKTRPLIASASHTWLEQDPNLSQPDFNPLQDRQGPLTLGLSLERQVGERRQRVVIMGDGDFLSNTYVGNSGNMELGMRIVNWLSSDDSLIEIPLRSIDDAELVMSQTALGVIGITLLLLLPLALCGTGIAVWLRRKNR